MNYEPLRPWRDSVPEASSRASRVDKLTAYLVDRNHRNGRNALVLFLRILTKNIYEDDDCHSQLTKMANRLESAFSRKAIGEYLIPEASPTGRPTNYIAADRRVRGSFVI